MLEKLTVDNYALIQHLELNLAPALNIVTGETGAGKSILLGALGMVCGSRTDVGVLKDTQKNCVVEAVFDLQNYGLEAFFEQHDLDFDRHTVVRRIITPAGKSRTYINDVPVQLALLKELSGHLIDIHSQNQSVLASDAGFRIRVLDALAGHAELYGRYQSAYRALREKEQEFARLKEALEAFRRERAFAESEWEQLSALGLAEGELAALEKEQVELANADAILGALSEGVEAVDSDQHGILSSLKGVTESLHRVEKVLEPAAGLAERLTSVYLELKDICAEMDSCAGRIENNPVRLEFVETRIGAVYSLMRRHGVETGDELVAIERELRAKLDSMSETEDNLAEIESRIGVLRDEAGALAAELTAGRRAAAEVFDREVGAMLGRLGMPAARFVTQISAAALNDTGADDVEFMFDANCGDRLFPLDKIASGGETSRVMLALKSIVARTTKLPAIIFDEIDTGVSGRIADAMGEIIAELGSSMQVVNITHLPQVASKGNTHFMVYKEMSDSGTVSRIKLLQPDERVREIAKMLSGTSVTDAALSQARFLLGYDKQ